MLVNIKYVLVVLDTSTRSAMHAMQCDARMSSVRVPGTYRVPGTWYSVRGIYSYLYNYNYDLNGLFILRQRHGTPRGRRLRPARPQAALARALAAVDIR